MTGMSDYEAKNIGNYLTGQVPAPSLPSVFLALFTAAGVDAGTGFTEISGNAYARVQVAGALAAAASFTTGVSTITMGSTIPTWVTAGMTVYDTTVASAIGTVLSGAGTTTLTLTANASHASSGTTDNLTFSAWPNFTGSAPSSATNGSVITFPQATPGNWGTAIAWGLYDASSSGNLMVWDFLGNFPWLPFEIPNASSTITAKAHGYASNDPIVFSPNEYGGTLPTLSTGTMTGYTTNFVASPATDSFTCDTTTGPVTPIVTTSSGSGMVRKITQQSIPSGVTASFAASTFTVSLA